MTYQEKLKDPRWQKKRLEILKRDDFTCQKCFDSENTLHIHHRYYRKCDPWEYPNEALLTLCENCHNEERDFRKANESDLIKILKESFLCDDIRCLAEGFHLMDLCHSSNVVASVISWAISDNDVQKELIERYFQSLKKDKDASA